MSPAEENAPPRSALPPQSLLDHIAETKRSWAEHAPTLAEQQRTFETIRAQIADSFSVHLSTPAAAGSCIGPAVDLLFALSDLGANDIPLSPEQLAEVEKKAPSTLEGLLYAMAHLPAWQTPTTLIHETPPWLAAVVTAYHLAGPRMLTVADQATRFTSDYIQVLRNLARACERDGAGAHIEALAAFRKAKRIPPSWAGDAWPEYTAAHARVLAAMDRSTPAPRALRSLEGRRLRLGIVASDLSPNAPLLGIVSCVERLDPLRFELFLFGPDAASALRTHLEGRGARYTAISEPDQALNVVRETELDVAWFVADPGQHEPLLHYLSRSRVAGVQVWHDGLMESPGIEGIDVVFSGATGHGPIYMGAAPRGVLLPGIGPVRRCEFTTGPAQELQREDLGLGNKHFVLVCFTALEALTPETKQLWAKLLARMPHARLLLCPGKAIAPEPLWLARFCAHFDQVLTENNASADQLLVLPYAFPSYAARASIIRIANAYLDNLIESDPAGAFAALEAGVTPIAGWSSRWRRAYQSTNLLHWLKLDHLAANTMFADYVEIVAGICASVGLGTSFVLTQRVAAIRAATDSFAQSEACGLALETVHAELLRDADSFTKSAISFHPPDASEAKDAIGNATRLLRDDDAAEALMHARYALAVDGGAIESRPLIARSLYRIGHHAMAADWFASLLDYLPATTDLWSEIGLACYGAGQIPNAKYAVNMVLSRDATHPGGLALLAKLEGTSPSAPAAPSEDAGSGPRRRLPPPRVIRAKTEILRPSMNRQNVVRRTPVAEIELPALRSTKRVVVIPAGRRRYLEVLVPHLAAQRDAFDELRLWLNTKDKDDLKYCRNLAANHPWIVAEESKLPVDGTWTICHFFRNCADPGTDYLRLDDDIIYLEPGFIGKIFAFRAAYPEYFLVFGNIINNAVVTHVQQRLGNLTINEKIQNDCLDPNAWKSGDFAEKLHRTFIESVEAGDFARWHFDRWVLDRAERISINCICWRGEEFAEFGGRVGKDEEPWLTTDYPLATQKPSIIYGGAVCVHFAFYPQRAHLDKTDILGRYANLSPVDALAEGAGAEAKTPVVAV